MNKGDKNLVVVENLTSKNGIGKYKFRIDPNYEYPIVEIPEDLATQIIESNKQDQLAANKRRKKMLDENKQRKTINDAERDPKKRLPLLKVPDEVNLENIRIGIPLEKVDGRRKKAPEV